MRGEASDQLRDCQIRRNSQIVLAIAMTGTLFSVVLLLTQHSPEAAQHAGSFVESNILLGAVSARQTMYDRSWREADIRRCVGFSYGRRPRRRPAAQGRAMSNGCTFSPPVINGFDGSKRSRSSRFLTSARATTKASFRLLACRSATLKKALPK